MLSSPPLAGADAVGGPGSGGAGWSSCKKWQVSAVAPLPSTEMSCGGTTWILSSGDGGLVGACAGLAQKVCVDVVWTASSLHVPGVWQLTDYKIAAIWCWFLLSLT